jgi:phosphonoacetaldehyde hydrolase
MKTKAVIFDWAGTLVDFGSQAPMGAFVQLFAQNGIDLTIEQARGPMGLPKWNHLEALGQQPEIAQQWKKIHGQAMSHSDVDRLYEEFTPMSARSAVEYAQIIPGVLETIARLRARGVRIGSTTGYNRAIMRGVVQKAKEQGLEPDNLVCCDDVLRGRPEPFGIYKCLLDLAVWPAQSVIKVDDTVPGLLEGRNAGCWTVAVTASGNETGVSLKDWEALSIEEKNFKRAAAKKRLSKAEPDFYIDSVADLMPIIETIESR